LLLVVIWAPIAQLALLVLVLLMIQHLASSDASVVGHLITVIVGSYAGGMVLGGVFSRRRRDNDRPSSRYIPSIQATSASHGRPSLSALARWPIASAFAWATPGTVRWPMMAAMLSVMSGSSALAGLLVVGFWMMMLYMITLLHSTLRVAEQAANWLRCTPISFRRFAVAICARSLLHQLLATAVIASLIAVETGTPFRSVLFAAPWIALVLVAYSTKVAYVFNARRGARISIAVSALSIAILEYLYRGAAVPLALLVCVWHFRWGAHAKLGGAVAHVT
jgi:hypothetical protein